MVTGLRASLAEPPARVALDDVQLALARFVGRAVGELAGQAGAVERRLAAGGLTGVAGGLTGP